MATGDIKNNIRKLVSELKQVSYAIQSIDYEAFIHGIPSAFLPILHHTLLDFSPDFASFLVKQDYELYARTDLRFVETVYRILRQEFSYKPSLTKQQFLSLGFAERKIILLTDIVKLCREKNKEICKKKKKSGKVICTSGKIAAKSSKSQSSQNMRSNENATVVSEVDGEGEQKEISSSSPKEKLSILSNEEGGILFKDKVADKTVIGFESTQIDKARNGLPLPKLSTLAWNINSETKSVIPKPCDSLIVTPLKDVENGVDVSAGKSRVDVIEVEDVELNAFKVVKHGVVMDRDEGAQGYVAREESLEKVGENLVKPSSLKALDSADYKQGDSNVASNNGCRCDCNHEVVKNLQEQMNSFQNSLKDLVTMNNELAARVILLETRNKLMEKKLDDFTSAPNINSDRDMYRISGTVESTIRQQRSNRRFKNGEWDEMDFPKDTETVEYSPDKYADVESSLPEDFQPINVAEMSANVQMKKTDTFSSPVHENEGENGKNDMLAEEGEKVGEEERLEVISDVERKEVLSPLRESELSFLEEHTRATVKNLQKKIQETMNMFQFQTNLTQL